MGPVHQYSFYTALESVDRMRVHTVAAIKATVAPQTLSPEERRHVCRVVNSHGSPQGKSADDAPRTPGQLEPLDLNTAYAHHQAGRRLLRVGAGAATGPRRRAAQPGRSFATVANTSGTGVMPTGTVTFKDVLKGVTTTLTTRSLVNGVATFTTSSLAAGSYTIEAFFNVTTDFLASSGNVLETIT